MSKKTIVWSLYNTKHGLQCGIVYRHDEKDNKFKEKPSTIRTACLEHLIDLVGATMLNSPDKEIQHNEDGTLTFSYSEFDASSDEGYNATDVMYILT